MEMHILKGYIPEGLGPSPNDKARMAEVGDVTGSLALEAASALPSCGYGCNKFWRKTPGLEASVTSTHSVAPQTVQPH